MPENNWREIIHISLVIPMLHTHSILVNVLNLKASSCSVLTRDDNFYNFKNVGLTNHYIDYWWSLWSETPNHIIHPKQLRIITNWRVVFLFQFIIVWWWGTVFYRAFFYFDKQVYICLLYSEMQYKCVYCRRWWRQRIDGMIGKIRVSSLNIYSGSKELTIVTPLMFRLSMT